MNARLHRARPLAWVFAASAMASAVSLVVLHWAPPGDLPRDGLEVAGAILLAFSVLATYVLEIRRLRQAEQFDGPLADRWRIDRLDTARR